jgi:hypothetical protein
MDFRALIGHVSPVRRRLLLHGICTACFPGSTHGLPDRNSSQQLSARD